MPMNRAQKASSITPEAVTFGGWAIFSGIENKSSYKDVFPDTFFM